jgi:hypothetical protein
MPSIWLCRACWWTSATALPARSCVRPFTGPNWVRVQSAKVKYSSGKAKLEFFTPTLRPSWLKESHTVTGSYEETYHPYGKSSGRYSYFFVVNTREPNIMKGGFRSAKDSPLQIKMQKID